MDIFNNLRQSFLKQNEDAKKKQQEQLEQEKKRKISAAKKQSLVNTLIMQRVPGGE